MTKQLPQQQRLEHPWTEVSLGDPWNQGRECQGAVNDSISGGSLWAENYRWTEAVNSEEEGTLGDPLSVPSPLETPCVPA